MHDRCSIDKEHELVNADYYRFDGNSYSYHGKISKSNEVKDKGKIIRL